MEGLLDLDGAAAASGSGLGVEGALTYVADVVIEVVGRRDEDNRGGAVAGPVIGGRGSGTTQLSLPGPFTKAFRASSTLPKRLKVAPLNPVTMGFVKPLATPQDFGIGHRKSSRLTSSLLPPHIVPPKPYMHRGRQCRRSERSAHTHRISVWGRYAKRCARKLDVLPGSAAFEAQSRPGL